MAKNKPSPRPAATPRQEPEVAAAAEQKNEPNEPQGDPGDETEDRPNDRPDDDDGEIEIDVEPAEGEVDARASVSVGDRVFYISSMRRAGLRNKDKRPAIVTDVLADGAVALTVFDVGQTRYVHRVTSNTKHEEHFVRS